MKLFALAMLAGCFPDAGEPCTERCPEVTGMSPETGDYGIEVTITGAFLGGGSVGFDHISCPIAPQSIGDTEIVVRVPFPASGNVFVNAGGNRLGAGTFTPTMPGPLYDVRASELLDARMLSNGELAAVYGQDIVGGSAQLVIFGTGAVAHGLSELGVAVADPALAAYVVDGAAGVEVITTDSDEVVGQVVFQDDQLVKRATGLRGRVIAAGRDGDQTVAWVETIDGTLVRAHAAAPTWVVDRGPFAWPTAALAAAIAPDGSLAIALATGGALVMQRATIAATLPPAEPVAATVGASARIAVSPDDADQMAIGSDGLYRRDAAGTWTTVSVPVPAGEPLVFELTPNGLAIAFATEPTGGVTMIADVDVPESVTVLPVWPARVDSLVPTGGTLRPLVTTCDRVYALGADPR